LFHIVGEKFPHPNFYIGKKEETKTSRNYKEIWRKKKKKKSMDLHGEKKKLTLTLT
jgi:hypothetical protein